MKNVIKSVLLASLLAISVAAVAQGQGQGRGQGGGRGGQFGMQGRGGMMGGPSALVNRADVQEDLKLTAAQKESLTKLREKQQEDQRAMMENLRNSGGGGGFDREAMTKMIQENQAKNEKAVNEILTAEQQKRLKEIWVQLQGNRAIMDAKIQDELGFDQGQKDAVKALQAKQQEAAMSLMEKMRNQEIDREQMTEISRKNDEVMLAELGKIMKEDQAAKLKAMGGAPFKAAPQQGRGGGGGGG